MSAQSDLTAGVCAGAANILVGFPFDTLKVRLQAERGVYRGAWNCLLRILKYEGVSRYPVRKTGDSVIVSADTRTLSWTQSTTHWRGIGDGHQLLCRSDLF